jgi:hypothetical protein
MTTTGPGETTDPTLLHWAGSEPVVFELATDPAAHPRMPDAGVGGAPLADLVPRDLQRREAAPIPAVAMESIRSGPAR